MTTTPSTVSLDEPDLSHIAEGLRGLAVSIASLVPDPVNARSHGEANLAAIQASLAAYGQYQPLVVQAGKRIVRVGNGRLAAARRLGWTHIAALVVEENDVQAVARALADNRTAELAEWNPDNLKALMGALKAEKAEPIGWTADEMQAILGDEPLPPPGDGGDEFDPAPQEGPTRTQVGELWALGPHRLLVGDSRTADAVSRLFGMRRADMMFTDPPYGVDYEGKTEERLKIQNDGELDLPDLLKRFMGLAVTHVKAGGPWYVCAPAGPLHWEFARVLMDLKVYRQTLVWVKDVFVLGHSDYHYRHEPIFYGWTPGDSHRAPPTRDQQSVWEIPRPKRSTDHPTMKPVELVEKAIHNSSDRGGVVYDPFLGSGTTLIACQRQGRVCFGLEIDPRYADVILRRAEAEGLEVSRIP